MDNREEYDVRIQWDGEARCWYVSDSNVPGLATNADTIGEMFARLRVCAPRPGRSRNLVQSAE